MKLKRKFYAVALVVLTLSVFSFKFTAATLATLEARSIRYADYEFWNYGSGNEEQINKEIRILVTKLQCLNRLLIPVNIYQENLASNEPHIDKRTVSKEVLQTIFKVARKYNLKIDILPTLLVDPENYEKMAPWAGEIQPSNPALWFDNYKNSLLYFAQIAQESGIVNVFLVGAELISMEKPEYKDLWNNLISSVKQVFSGKISYQTNWWWNEKNYKRARDNFPWDSVDYIGLNSYFEITDNSEALTYQLINGWFKDRHNQNIVNDITKFYHKYNKPIIFWETGYQSKDETAIYPWNFLLATEEDEEEQYRAYQALRLVWNVRDFIKGYSIFVAQYNQVPVETGFTRYSPLNKKAENEARMLLCQ